MISPHRRTAHAVVAALLAVLLVAPTFASAAKADTAGQVSTRNLILGGLAAVAAVVLYNNYHHKQVAANTVVGRTQDGGIVYADGRVVYPDGSVLYTGNRSGYRCSYDGRFAPCGEGTEVFGPHGWHLGWRNHHHHGDGDDQGENDDD